MQIELVLFGVPKRSHKEFEEFRGFPFGDTLAPLPTMDPADSVHFVCRLMLASESVLVRLEPGQTVPRADGFAFDWEALQKCPRSHLAGSSSLFTVKTCDRHNSATHNYLMGVFS